MNRIIIPAVIAKTQTELDDRILKVKDYVNRIQLDIMDGKFVPNTSLDFDFILPATNIHFEAHLMIENPEDWIEKQGDKADTLLVQIEAAGYPERVIDLAKKRGKKIGFVLNPETSIEAVEPYLEQLDQVLIMTVHPGFYGSPFLPDMLVKIREMRKRQPRLNIEADGGVTVETIGLVNRAGANLFVSGSYIMKAPSVKEAIMNLKRAMKGTDG